MIPWAHPSPKPKWHLDWFSCFSHSSLQSVSLYFAMCRPFPLKNCPFQSGDLDPIIYTVSWANPSPKPKQHLDRFSRFCRAHLCDRKTD